MDWLPLFQEWFASIYGPLVALGMALTLVVGLIMAVADFVLRILPE